MRPKRTLTLLTWSIAALALWLSSPSRVLAADDTVENMLKNRQSGQTPVAPQTAAGDGSLLWSMFQLLFALGIIIAVIYLLIRFLSSRSNALLRGPVFQSLGAQTLANNRSVHLISVGDKVYLLGVGEDITLLDTITDAKQIEQLRDSSQTQQNAALSGWQQILGKFRPGAKMQQVEEVDVNNLTFDLALREKLHHLKEQRQQKVGEWEGEER
jgi:flagellar protein FliO/FliZ